MKRGIIYNNGHTIVIPNEEIWMTAWEIADLFYVTPISINHVIKRILKEKVLIESQVRRYICLENGNHADVYNLEMVIALSFHFDTGHSILFRRWLIRKASTLADAKPYKARFGQAIRAFSCPFSKNHCRLGTYYAILLFANSDFCAWVSPTKSSSWQLVS